jgi:cytochrome P450
MAPIAPGPRGRPFVGILPDLRRDAIGALAGWHRAYGDLVRVRIFGRDGFLLGHPDAVKHVLQDNHRNYRKPPNYGRLRPLVGNGLLTSEGEEWRRQRRLAQPAFHRERVAGFARIMTDRTTATIAAWAPRADGAPTDVFPDLMALTLAVVGDALFSIDLASHAGDAGASFTVALEILNRRLRQVVVAPSWWPTRDGRRLRQALGRLEVLVETVIRERRASADPHADLLGMWMAARDEDGVGGMDDRQLRDEVMTMVLAGHETTAAAIAFALGLLARDADVQARVQAEVDAVLADRVPGPDDLGALELVGRLAREALRLYPSAWRFGRAAIADDEIDGCTIPAGSIMFIVPYLLHRDARFWPDPERFDLDRFAPEPIAARPKFAYVPFAAGPRQCIGNAFALVELQLVLAMLIRAFGFAPEAPGPIEIDPNVTLRPRGGMRVRLTPRAPRPPSAPAGRSTPAAPGSGR